MVEEQLPDVQIGLLQHVHRVVLHFWARDRLGLDRFVHLNSLLLFLLNRRVQQSIDLDFLVLGSTAFATFFHLADSDHWHGLLLVEHSNRGQRLGQEQSSGLDVLDDGVDVLSAVVLQP